MRVKIAIIQVFFYLLFPHSISAQTLNDGLVAYWSFDEGSGAIAQDSTGNGNTGTLVNGPSWVTGRVGNALSFDGNNDYVEVSDNNDLDLTGEQFTLCAWIYPESFGEDANGRVIDHGGGSDGEGGWSFLVNNYSDYQGLRTSLRNGMITSHSYSDISSITLNAWQHAAVTFQSGTVTFYVDGQIKGQESGLPNPTDRNGPVRIGMRATDLFRSFTGIIDEVRMYDRALSSLEISGLYNQPPPLSDVNPPVISNGQPSALLPLEMTTATLSVTTDEAATCKYTIEPDTPYSSMTDTFSITGGTTHTNPMSGLEFIQSRTYYIKCRDQSSNSNPVDYAVSFSFNRTVYSVSLSGSDSNPGTEGLPLKTIQHALDIASGNNSVETVIKVAQGTYYENISLVCCTSRDNWRILGGWDNDFRERDEDPSKTVIDGGGKRRVIKINVSSLSLTIEGFTIRNGFDSVGGGGIYVFPLHNGNITLSLINNIIAKNRSGSYGGGVYVSSKEHSTITLNFSSNVIVNNSANDYCGGICVNAEDSASTILTFTNNVVKDNLAGYHGGGIYVRSYNGASITSTFSRNAITENSAASFGAGVYAYSESDATLTADFTNNIIKGNKDVYSGGGVYMHSVYRAAVTANFTNNIITGNSASLHGGGIYSLSASGATLSSSYTNNLITGNSAGYDGGGVFNWGTTTSTFMNNTITGNKAAYLGGGLRMTDGPIIIITKEDTWKYDIENSGITWMDPGYDDSLWSTGGGIFGTEENLDITTDISNTHLSMFFRKTFAVGDPGEVTALTLNSLFDDGMAVYINGTLVYSENVSEDPPLYNGGVSSQHEAEYYEAKDLTGVIGLDALRNLLVAGTSNVIAVGIYNRLPASSDIVWDGELVISHDDTPSVTDIYNNIIRGNIADFCEDLMIHNDINGSINAYNNNIDPAKVCAAFTNEGNNINSDPLFVATGYWDDNGTPADSTDDFWIEGDYHLSSISECIDAGDNISLPSDYENDPRTAGAVDIGADERYVSSVNKIYYCDYDHDGYIDSTPSNICYSAECEILHCDITPGSDCNDTDFYEHPSQIWYKDFDNDNYSDGTPPLVSCARPSGHGTDLELTATSGDCDDTNALISPEAPEVWYDGVDQDCDGWNDYDQDRDTCVHENWNDMTGGTSTCINDCDDTNPAINPQTNWYPDFDGDGYGNHTIYLVQCNQPAGYVLDNLDCDDNDVHIYPGGPPVRILSGNPSYYSYLQDAYDAANTGETIQSQDAVYSEYLFFDMNKSVNIDGGYDCAYSVITGITTVSGNMTLDNGSVSIENLELQVTQDYEY